MVSWMDRPKNVEPRSKEVYSQRALDLHLSSLVVDTHADSSYTLSSSGSIFLSLSEVYPSLPTMRRGRSS